MKAGLEPIDWAQEARDGQAAAKKRNEESRKTSTEERHEGTQPSHHLADFTGTFEHAGYGTTEVSLENGTLEMATVGFEAPLEHYHYDVFQVPTGLEGRNAPLGGGRIARKLTHPTARK